MMRHERQRVVVWLHDGRRRKLEKCRIMMTVMIVSFSVPLRVTCLRGLGAQQHSFRQSRVVRPCGKESGGGDSPGLASLLIITI